MSIQTVAAAVAVLHDVRDELRAIGRDVAAAKIEGAARELAAAADVGGLTQDKAAELDRAMAARRREVEARHAAEMEAELQAVRDAAMAGTNMELAAELVAKTARVAELEAGAAGGGKVVGGKL